MKLLGKKRRHEAVTKERSNVLRKHRSIAGVTLRVYINLKNKFKVKSVYFVFPKSFHFMHVTTE